MGSAGSFIRRDVFNQLKLRAVPTRRAFHQPDRSLLRPAGSCPIYFGIPDESKLSLSNFHVVDDFFVPLLLGRKELKLLPFKVQLDGVTIFEGAAHPQPKTFPPELAIGDGIKFEGGDAYQQRLIKDVLVQHKDNIFEWSGTMGVFRDHVIDLPTSDEIPVVAKPFGIGPPKLEALKGILQEYADRDWIEPSTSPYGSPAFLHPKKTPPGQPQKWRLVEDYTLLNKKLQDDPHPVPSVQQLIDALGPQASWFISLDLTSGYHHCPLTVASRKKTAFVTPLGTFQYKVLPFGLKSAPSIFQRTLESILRHHLKKHCLVYLDDIIIYGSTFNELLHNFKLVMETLTSAGAAIGIKKCTFLSREINYLGHVISQGNVKPAPEATQAVLKYPQPETVKELQRFLGLATYVRNHVPHFAELEYTIRTIMPTVATTRLQWTQQATAAFHSLKQAVHDVVTLTIFDPAGHHTVLADASAQALGAVLLQSNARDSMRPVAFASRVLTDAESRYSNSEREALALKWAVTEKFRPYLEGRKFKLGTDHKALLGDIRLQPHTARLKRLLLQLAPYNFDLEHIPAQDMGAPDALSRITVAALVQPPDNPKVQIDLINDCHRELGHAHWKKVYNVLRQRTAWPGIRQQVWRTVLGCPQCQVYNAPTGQVGGQYQPITSSRPNEKLVLDIIGPLAPDDAGCKYAFIAVDYFSRFATVQMLRRPTTRAAILAVKQIFHQLGHFDWVLSDPGTQFTSKAFKKFLRQHKVHQYLGSPRNYRATGVVERLARTLKVIAAKMTPQDLTARALTAAVLDYNRTPHSATGTTPISAFFHRATPLQIDARLGTQPPPPPSQAQVQQNQWNYASSWAARLNRNRPAFQPGDRVIYYPKVSTVQAHAANRHLRPRASGPLTVLGYRPRNRLHVTGPFGQRILPASRFRLSHYP
jgi:transposase InsO family protein